MYKYLSLGRFHAHSYKYDSVLLLGSMLLVKCTSNFTVIRSVSATLPPQPPMPRVPLVCTYSKEFSDEMMFPQDGLCDVIFYDSLYCNNENKFADPPSSDLSDFLDLSTGLKKTEFGISVAFRWVCHSPLCSERRLLKRS